MQSPQLHALGFDFRSMDALVNTAFKAGVQGIKKAPGFDLVASYTDPSGARLAFSKLANQGMSTAGALHTDITHRAQVVRFTDQLARIAAYATGDDGGLLAQFIALVDDPSTYPLTSLTEEQQYAIVSTLQVGALALDVTLYPDEDAFRASPASTMGEHKLSPRNLMSPSLIALQAAAISPFEASPITLMGAVVRDVETRTNKLTGKQFHYVTADSVLPLNCALPIELSPAPGNVMHGTWFVTASSGTWDRQ